MTKQEEEIQENIDSELKKSDSKQNNSSKKSHGEILKEQICEGQETYNKKASSIILSSLTAGLEIGFSFLLICTLFYYAGGSFSEETLFKLISLVYPVGFILVILGQSILFTEQTSLLTLPILNNKREAGSLFRIWGLVIFGNLLGGYLMSLVLIWIGPKLGIFEFSTFEAIAKHVTKPDSLTIFVSAILAGWLMGLLSWLLTSSSETISRIVIIFVITATMSFTGLHHSIIGNIEVFSGMITSPQIEFIDYLKFICFAILGNAIGGAVFVALLKYRAFVYNVDGNHTNY
ncbi:MULTISPECIES: formate/nitrite transporter family protein [Mesonia]|uniref:Inner membrane protein YfdC n=1 Tax=Mesonia oceanica TaxID=2687242 RepID=A0AC61Y3W0_9FLAO|nr:MULTISPECIES: formate/nitrite transporter family protein [Mesonia]MAN28768.1 formate transporter [Mesonia sp.]MAQ41901.1 formate transporter [Mesonia sp.]MBJ98978.1 formate transporter [Flavobacteriaceae bacterium]VVU99173.1 Inner membrane protein YfdC [Mesonia oceanica]|tara:strand:- start:8084 stop:8953 length:870 start_codon:yes stop_codon:yes gene_type:complete